MSDLDTVREALAACYSSEYDAALDRIEAVVKAARDVRYDVMNEGFLSQETSDQVHAALEALDSQEERT